MFRVKQDSVLRKHPAKYSETQIVYLDGIRYSADMAGIALDRLWAQLCKIDEINQKEPYVPACEVAAAALDAWSIIDAAHRMHDLIMNLPGLKNATWKRLFSDRVTVALSLRDVWQHIASEASQIVQHRGQAWGALAWVRHEGLKPTPFWQLAVIGSDLKGSSWLHVGPFKAIDRVDSRRVKLIHSGKNVYLSRLVSDMFEALGQLENTVVTGELRLVGEPVNQARGTELIVSTVVEVMVRRSDTQTS